MGVSLSRRAFLGGAEPTPAPDSPRLAVVGQGCLAARGVYCRSCAESCEAAALRIRPLPGGRAEIAIDPDRCTGCGDCLGVCPVEALSLQQRPPDDA
ncbi:4Fe-4S dicluster domain-containing protein [Albimonas sp. CAU 1670]|uniref:4Fe-4S dicluster domain-containing protein n=1 Tax=Albimonas sp. CAU 1670 TaxID=3032599 RepID=UPI0023DAB13E|nr:4Fe-4S dicluster domain-containing protein [Albimonas sp. CAU 1670]MDF2233182.1 4Fe-4S dicluster domain-containing protein [Albimonas sp. CAU 1670]